MLHMITGNPGVHRWTGDPAVLNMYMELKKFIFQVQPPSN